VALPLLGEIFRGTDSAELSVHSKQLLHNINQEQSEFILGTFCLHVSVLVALAD